MGNSAWNFKAVLPWGIRADNQSSSPLPLFFRSSCCYQQLDMLVRCIHLFHQYEFSCGQNVKRKPRRVACEMTQSIDY